MKKSVIIPIHKNNNKNNIENYRPISIIPQVIYSDFKCSVSPSGVIIFACVFLEVSAMICIIMSGIP